MSSLLVRLIEWNFTNLPKHYTADTGDFVLKNFHLSNVQIFMEKFELLYKKQSTHLSFFIQTDDIFLDANLKIPCKFGHYKLDICFV